MRRIGNRIGAWLFTLAVAASLTFGGSTLVASPAAAAACPNNAGTGEVGVACVRHRDCEEPCQSKYGHSGGSCLGGCCYCPY